MSASKKVNNKAINFLGHLSPLDAIFLLVFVRRRASESRASFVRLLLTILQF